MGRVNCDHIKRLITLTSDNITRLSLYQKDDIILHFIVISYIVFIIFIDPKIN
jgi:hypothetical protein